MTCSSSLCLGPFKEGVLVILNVVWGRCHSNQEVGRQAASTLILSRVSHRLIGMKLLGLKSTSEGFVLIKPTLTRDVGLKAPPVAS